MGLKYMVKQVMETCQKHQLIDCIGKTHPRINIIESQSFLDMNQGYANPSLWILNLPAQITVGIQGSHDEWIATVAHELGHHIIGFSTHLFLSRAAMQRVPILWDCWKLPTLIGGVCLAIRRRILLEETRAWDAGLKYLTEHNWEITTEMLNHKRSALQSYGDGIV